jgi:hypothetical protein
MNSNILVPVLIAFYVEDHPVNTMLMSALFERRPGYRLGVGCARRHCVQPGESRRTPRGLRCRQSTS